jgi:hypothetical protein
VSSAEARDLEFDRALAEVVAAAEAEAQEAGLLELLLDHGWSRDEARSYLLRGRAPFLEPVPAAFVPGTPSGGRDEP